MLKVEIRPDWILRDARGKPVALPALLALLGAVSETGSISKAATRCRMSYRHAWGLLQQFSEQFGAQLVHKVRGQGTLLSPLAEKLIWADRRISARLSPLLDSLASELQQELARVLAADAQVLRLTASHGFAVAALVAQLGEQGVNRQHGSGTRVLLELLLADRALDPHRIAGFDSAEFTHAAVAAYVASGMADVSFGVETAARRFDLDFIPICRERYFLACNKGALATPSLQAAREAMASDSFRSALAALPGYDGSTSGTLETLF
jgi:molybdate transport repressor ModE-like protein